MKSKGLAIRWVEDSISRHCCICRQYVTYQEGPALFKERKLVCDQCAPQFLALGWILVFFWIGIQESEEIEPGFDEDPTFRARLIMEAMSQLMSVANGLRETLGIAVRSEVNLANLRQLSHLRSGNQPGRRI